MRDRMTPREKAEALLDSGLADSFEDACHQLEDMGEIDEVEAEDLLMEEGE